MDRDELVAAVMQLLERADWEQSRLSTGNCFDLFAAGEDASLILKVADNVDSTDRADAEELRRACRFLGAAPLLVGRRTSRGALEPQVVYERYDIPTIRPETLEAYLRLQQPAVVYNRRGGYYVSLDPEKLEERRKEEGYSLNALAKEIGVSRKTVRNYRERGTAQLEKAKRLEETLGDVTAPITIMHTEIEVSRVGEHPVAERLLHIGMDASGFRKAPFDAAARDAEDTFVAKHDRGRTEDALLTFLRTLSDLSGSTTFMVTERDEDYGDIATVTRRDLDRLESKEALKDELRP